RGRIRRLEVVPTSRNAGAFVETPVPFGGNEILGDADPAQIDAAVGGLLDIRMNGFVRQVKAEGLMTGTPDDLDGALGEYIGDIAARLPDFAVDVEHRVDRLALAREADPVVEAGARRIVVAHVPLAEKSGLVAGVVQLPWPGKQLMAARRAVGVVNDAVA